MNRWGVAVIAAVLIAAAACSSEGESKPSSTPPSSSSATVSATPTPSPTPTESAAVTAAKAAYQGFMTASFKAQRSPKKVKFKALNELSVDPALSDLEKSLIFYQVNNLAFRGEPPRQRLAVVSDDPGATPYPTVRLADCPTVSASWKPFDLVTGKPARTVQTKAAPPYRTDATVIFYKGRWAVQKADTDTTKTCSP